ncbi:helix-turn-helix domain-containing protein [Albidovulum sediminicola]|uniref:Helix-turn-helix domain-containing protein n=1 Tax=Albidovulum sediminicola TaxID=2984331 RepID=A0ABT2YZU0_9RHOB|nr:helix-turn-helix domain-containing protein [Defluviimonas sp. WL0075]MCV2864366.1 helix-turn-helix domain-containing protein [Defluviimonas sp. WL0075]
MTAKIFSATPLSLYANRIPKAESAAVSAPPAERPAQPPKATARPAEPRRAPQPLPADDGGLRLVPIQRLAQGGRWRVEAMRSYNGPVLYWFTRGQGRVTVGGVTRGYGAHNAIFVPAGAMHGFEAGPQSFGIALFFGNAEDLGLPQEPMHLRVRDAIPQGELSNILDQIQREVEAAKPGHERAARHYLGLLSVWLERHAGAAETGRSGAYHRLARRYADLLEDGFRSGQGVADFARALGVTPTHLTRVCRNTCGRSASDLLHDRVIFEARRMLLETRLPVARVSEQLGFTSPAYFTRAFQHRTGKTPSAFRRGA